MMFGGLFLALATGLLVALPQVIPAVRYYPKCVRSSHGTHDKQTIGNLSPLRVLQGICTTHLHDQPDGVFYPEACAYVGLLGLFFALFSRSWHQWLLLVSAGVLAMGRWTPVFHWCSAVMLRIPARMMYFVNLALVFMGISGLSIVRLPARVLVALLLLQACDLAMNTSRLWPMHPYVQRWARPSRAFNNHLVNYLQTHLQGHRISGLPFPLTTGQVHGFRTLGYNAGSALQAMARFRGTSSQPMGGGGHSWFDTREDSEDLDWYGVKYAYTFRDLTRHVAPCPHWWWFAIRQEWYPTDAWPSPCALAWSAEEDRTGMLTHCCVEGCRAPFPRPHWRTTPIPHLFENTHVAETVPEWSALETRNGV